METRYIDRQAERAAKRIATALDMPVGTEIKAAALSAAGELHIQIRDLQRQNLELRYLVENHGFDPDVQIEKEEQYVRRCFSTNVQLNSIFNRYDYEYFLDMYHPGYIYKLCKALVSLFGDYKVEPADLWSALIVSTGYITEEITDTFGQEDVDENEIY
jgi:hypothetical protein